MIGFIFQPNYNLYNYELNWLHSCRLFWLDF